MQVAATQAKNRFGAMCALAKTEPVFVEKDGRIDSVVVSAKQFARLQAERKRWPSVKSSVSCRTVPGSPSRTSVLRRMACGATTCGFGEAPMRFNFFENPSPRMPGQHHERQAMDTVPSGI